MMSFYSIYFDICKTQNELHFKYYKFAIIKTCENETAKSTMTNLKLQVTLLYLNFANKMLFVIQRLYRTMLLFCY